MLGDDGDPTKLDAAIASRKPSSPFHSASSKDGQAPSRWPHRRDGDRP